jgi:hypothetical protein
MLNAVANQLHFLNNCLDVGSAHAISQNTSLTKLTCDDQNVWTEILPLIVEHPSLDHLRIYMDGIDTSLLYNSIFSGTSSMARRHRVLKLQWLQDPVDGFLMTTLLQCCPALTRLKFTSCLIMPSVSRIMVDSNIKTLVFSECNGLDDDAVAPLFEMKSLTFLELDICDVTYKTALLIATNTTITDLSLNSDIGEAGVVAILKNNRTLNRFVIEGMNVEEEWLTVLNENDSLLWIGFPLKGTAWIEFYRKYPHVPHLTVTTGKYISDEKYLWESVKECWRAYHNEIVVSAAICFAAGYLFGHIIGVRKGFVR